MKNKIIRYLIFKNGEMKVKETDDFNKVIKKELGRFDTADYLFDDDLSIRVLVKAESLFNENETIYYYYKGEYIQPFCGTVIFTKTNTSSFKSLSKQNIKLLTENTYQIDETRFKMYSN